MEKKINIFDSLDKDPFAGIRGIRDIKANTLKPWPWLDLKPDFSLESYKDIMGNNNESIRVLGTRSFTQPIQTKHLNSLIQPGIARVKNVRSYKPKKETKLLKTGKACPYWKENGWKKIDRTYCGYYKTCYGNWEGSVKENFFNNHSYFIFDPPEKVLDGDHGACFRSKGHGAYLIHFSEKPENVSEGIIAVEMLVAESIRRS